MRGFLIALQFLTRLPTPAIRVEPDAFARSMRWFPAVGLVIGTGLAGVAWAGALLDDWVGAAAALIWWVGVTGALHLDGLGDLADASGAAHNDRARIIAVLADPHIGSFGVVAIALQLIVKLVLLHFLISVGAMVLLIGVPFAARIGPLCWTLWIAPLHEGLGARFRDGIRAKHIMFWAVVLVAASVLAPACLVTPALILAWGWHVRRSIGGISGDGHGAGIEVTETGLLLALALSHTLKLGGVA